MGIAPRSGHIQGIRDPKATLDRLFQAALLVDPPLVLPIPQVEKIDDHQIVRVAIPRGLPHVYCLDGRFLGRSGYHTSLLSTRQLRELMIERGVIQFESQIPLDATLDDLDPDKVSAYVNRLKMTGVENQEDLLLRRGCLKSHDGILGPTYAGILLFGKSPQQWVPSASMLVVRFSGVAYADEFIKQDIQGTLPEQIRQAEIFVRDISRSVVRLVGLSRQEKPEYPLEAIRELLVNAVAHRDYNLQGDNIHLHIFADRLEVQSPGGLPGPVNLENLLDVRFSRNAVITQVLSDMGFVERLGYGLNRVVSVMRKNNLPAPIFKELGGSFRVTLLNSIGEVADGRHLMDPSRFSKHNLNSRQELLLSHLLRKGKITNRTYQEHCPDVSPETLRRDLMDMVKKGILIKIGDKKSTYYILK